MAGQEQLSVPRYGREVFVAIQETYLGDMGARDLEVRDTGVWLPSSLSTLFAWAPACDLDGPDSPDPLSTPALPFPFTAGQLAAWMLDGWGSFVWEAVFEADSESTPEENAERAFGRLGDRGKKVRAALSQAYEARQRVAHLLGASMQLDIGDAAAEREWRCAMVQALWFEQSDCYIEPEGIPLLPGPSKEKASKLAEQMDAILEILVTNGFDPLNLTFRNGQPSPAKQIAWLEFQKRFPSSKFRPAWQELLNLERIKHTPSK